jgi:hypothetical protein
MALRTAVAGPAGLWVATPSVTAAWTTAAAVIADDSRRFSTAGSREAPGMLTSTWPAAGMASIWEVGLESGKMIGRSVTAAIASTTCRVNAPCTVEVPSRIAHRSGDGERHAG